MFVLPLRQGQPDQAVCLVGQEDGDVQHIVIQLQVFQREAHAELDLIGKQLLEFFHAFAGDIGL